MKSFKTVFRILLCQPAPLAKIDYNAACATMWNAAARDARRERIHIRRLKAYLYALTLQIATDDKNDPRGIVRGTVHEYYHFGTRNDELDFFPTNEGGNNEHEEYELWFDDWGNTDDLQEVKARDTTRTEDNWFDLKAEREIEATYANQADVFSVETLLEAARPRIQIDLC